MNAIVQRLKGPEFMNQFILNMSKTTVAEMIKDCSSDTAESVLEFSKNS